MESLAPQGGEDMESPRRRTASDVSFKAAASPVDCTNKGLHCTASTASFKADASPVDCTHGDLQRPASTVSFKADASPVDYTNRCLQRMLSRKTWACDAALEQAVLTAPAMRSGQQVSKLGHWLGHLFPEIPILQLQKIGGSGHEYVAGEIVHKAGKRPEYFYVVMRGSLNITSPTEIDGRWRMDHQLKNFEDKVEFLHTLNPLKPLRLGTVVTLTDQAIIGDITVLSHVQRRTASVIATSDMVMYKIQSAVFTRALPQDQLDMLRVIATCKMELTLKKVTRQGDMTLKDKVLHGQQLRDLHVYKKELIEEKMGLSGLGTIDFDMTYKPEASPQVLDQGIGGMASIGVSGAYGVVDCSKPKLKHATGIPGGIPYLRAHMEAMAAAGLLPMPEEESEEETGFHKIDAPGGKEEHRDPSAAYMMRAQESKGFIPSVFIIPPNQASDQVTFNLPIQAKPFNLPSQAIPPNPANDQLTFNLPAIAKHVPAATPVFLSHSSVPSLPSADMMNMKWRGSTSPPRPSDSREPMASSNNVNGKSSSGRIEVVSPPASPHAGTLHGIDNPRHPQLHGIDHPQHPQLHGIDNPHHPQLRVPGAARNVGSPSRASNRSRGLSRGGRNVLSSVSISKLGTFKKSHQLSAENSDAEAAARLQKYYTRLDFHAVTASNWQSQQLSVFKCLANSLPVVNYDSGT
eukprot:gene21883-28920_t